MTHKTVVEDLWDVFTLAYTSLTLGKTVPGAREAVEYLRLAALRSLRADGVMIAEGYDPHTGHKKTPPTSQEDPVADTV